MSKSYHNTISPFMPEKELYKAIMAIPTDSTPLEKPKDPTKCHVFALYRLLANKQQLAYMQRRYLAGGYGYGRAKKALFSLIIERFAKQRTTFNKYVQDSKALEAILVIGEAKAQRIATTTMQRVRNVLGY